MNAASAHNDKAINSFAKDEKNEDTEQIIPDIKQLAIEADPNPIPNPNNDEHKHGGEVDGSDDEDGPTLTLPLEQDVLRKDHLLSFRSRTPEPVPTKTYRPSEQQLLQEGKLGDSCFSARLKRVKFGRYATATGERVPACLILVRIDFIPKGRGWFRFRDANVEISFTDRPGAGSDRLSTDHDDDYDDDDDDYDDDDAVYTGPLVLQFYPDLIRGHTRSVSEQYNLSVGVPLVPLLAGSPTLSAGMSGTRNREGLHLVQGRLMGEPETRVKWKMQENEVLKGGLYEQLTLAVVVRYREGEPFTMALNVKATTYGGLAVNGKRGARITFKPGQSGAKKEEPSMAGLTGGSVQVGGQTWGVKQGASTEPSDEDLEAEDLEALTGMRAVLLGAQGPGSATPSG